LDDESLVDIRCRAGIPVPLVDLEIVDQIGKPLPHDGKAKGEVVVRSPWLAQAYYKEPEKSEELWRDGWLHTGDVGFMDQDGYLHITDRIKDVIKTGGEWGSSLELEDLISRHEAVMEVAVIGIPHSKWGERPVALAVIKPGLDKTTTADALKSFCEGFALEGIMPRYGIPDQILIVENIAKTSVGKLNKKLLREQYQAISMGNN